MPPRHSEIGARVGRILRIVLINPGQLPDAGEDQFAGRIDSLFFRARPFAKTYFGIPLALPTLAGLTPHRHQVRIVDEMVAPVDYDQPCDLVGLSAMTCKATRAYQIAEQFRKRGVPVVMGGIHASMCPDEVARHVDCVVIGEADDLWPRLLDDAEAGRLQARYLADAFPDLTTLPPPRHDLTPHSRYFCYFLQTTRGCPRGCKFCTVTAHNGKVLRKKTPAQIVAEVKLVVELPNPLRPTVVDRERGGRRRRLASGTIFFVDDNFALDRKHALAVCHALEALQEEREIHLNWFTQSDVNTGFDDELLAAMKDAGCMNIFMGLESLHAESLHALNKDVNVPAHYGQCIANVERHGMDITTSVIVGTDDEDAGAGKEMSRFVDHNHIFYLFPNIMTPYPGTQLREQIETEGRLLRREPELYNVRNVVFVPKRMSPPELRSLFVDLCSDSLNLERLLRIALEKIRRPHRYYLTRRWRFLTWLVFSFIYIVLALRRQITSRDAVRLLRCSPRLLLRDGSMAALGYLVSSIGFGTFARSERRRLRERP
jgi:radical SAM superfamily enzyme YgiQ (UPF0313 family)